MHDPGEVSEHGAAETAAEYDRGDEKRDPGRSKRFAYRRRGIARALEVAPELMREVDGVINRGLVEERALARKELLRNLNVLDVQERFSQGATSA